MIEGIDLFNIKRILGIEEFTIETARKLLGKALMGKKDKDYLQEVINERLDDIVFQSLIYTLSTGKSVYHYDSVLNPLEDLYGIPYTASQKLFAPLKLLISNDLDTNPDSNFTIDERYDDGLLRYMVRWSGAPDYFLVSVNPEELDTRVIYKSQFSQHFPFETLNENIFTDGPVNFILCAGYTFLPIVGVTEISNIGNNVTYDKEGKHNCKYSNKDFSM
jgi:hypothetical protein